MEPSVNGKAGWRMLIDHVVAVPLLSSKALDQISRRVAVGARNALLNYVLVHDGPRRL